LLKDIGFSQLKESGP